VILLLQAITSPPDAAAYDVASGLRGGQMVTVADDGLVAWATELPHPDAAFTRDDLLAHHRLVSEIDERVAACLPARFPTWFDDVDALRRRLDRSRDELSRLIEEVRGCCELAVTALWIAPEQAAAASEEPSSTPGRRYLAKRRDEFAASDSRRARAHRLADELEQATGADLLRAQRQVCPSATVALSSALLVRRSTAQNVKVRLRRTDQHVRILVNGPWPPYTFAGVRSD
jgi:gas vesicle protein GvpL/GvpF